MHFNSRMIIAFGCAGLLAMSVPAFSQPASNGAERQQHTNSTAQKKKAAKRAFNRSSGRLVSRTLTQPPKRPAQGWPALVSEARKYMGTNPTARKRLWCATFMNMVLAKVGYAGTNSDAAKSFAQYGRRISDPKVGAIAVLTRGKNGGHVGVVSGVDANGNPIIISGNHGRRVGEAIYPRGRVIAYVMPAGGRSATAQVSERSASSRPLREASIESPLTELLAAIESEQSRQERPRQQQQAVPARSEVPHLTVQQTAEPPRNPSRNLPLAPALAELFGIRGRS